MRAIRGDRIAMIFQEPMSSLNPALTVGLQVAEPVQPAPRHALGAGAGDRRPKLLDRCASPTPPSRLHDLSAPVVRRHAPARDDRHGAGLPAAS
jgi:oligopeptide transport system ATP-binding protein